jgi:hypothetical protein
MSLLGRTDSFRLMFDKTTRDWDAALKRDYRCGTLQRTHWKLCVVRYISLGSWDGSIDLGLGNDKASAATVLMAYHGRPSQQ